MWTPDDEARWAEDLERTRATLPNREKCIAMAAADERRSEIARLNEEVRMAPLRAAHHRRRGNEDTARLCEERGRAAASRLAEEFSITDRMHVLGFGHRATGTGYAHEVFDMKSGAVVVRHNANRSRVWLEMGCPVPVPTEAIEARIAAERAS